MQLRAEEEVPRQGAVWSGCGGRQQPRGRYSLGTAVHPASTTPAFWDAFTDVDAFVDEVLAELT